MNIEKLRQYAKQGDIILLGGSGWLSKLIGFGQRTQTPGGKPSKWSHVVLYVDKDTVWESTIDFSPYPATEGKRLDNGVQYDYLEKYKDTKNALLLHFPFTDEQRGKLADKMQEMIVKGYTYPILGLVGSLLSYWLFRWKSNTLQTKNSLYCSAAVQEGYSVIPIDFDPAHTSRNTSPQAIDNYNMEGLERIEL